MLAERDALPKVILTGTPFIFLFTSRGSPTLSHFIKFLELYCKGGSGAQNVQCWASFLED